MTAFPFRSRGHSCKEDLMRRVHTHRASIRAAWHQQGREGESFRHESGSAPAVRESPLQKREGHHRRSGLHAFELVRLASSAG
jgi:hypothetical protein